MIPTPEFPATNVDPVDADTTAVIWDGTTAVIWEATETVEVVEAAEAAITNVID